MNYLLDTHILLWTFVEPRKIRPEIFEIYNEGEGNVFYSPVSLWEIAIKFKKGNLDFNYDSPEEFLNEIGLSLFKCKPLDNDIITSSYRLPLLHNDPFDRLLIWDALTSGFTLVSDDSLVRQYKQHGLRLL